MGFEEHKFFCPICGEAGIPLMRKTGHKHKKFHRKWLYCPTCKKETNHVEVTNEEEENLFFENMELGVYDLEEEESLAALRVSRKWENN
jgi:formate dehydrogenase maturation protein FdhE